MLISAKQGIKMKTVEIKQDQAVYGITIRTNNTDESRSETAQIGKLWGHFYEQIAPKMKEGSKVYGVYSHYESDYNGEFDVSACVDQKVIGTKKLVLKSGKYLVFSGKGEMPLAVIEAWKKIWKYFASENIAEKRLYETDYEYYKSPTEVEIYIGVI